MISMLLIDDHAMVRGALAQILSSQPGFEVMGQAGDAQEAWQLLSDIPVDVIICDLEMPGQSGRELALRIMEAKPEQAILVLSYRTEPDEVQFLIEAGVKGYVPKTAASDELVAAVRRLAQGQEYYSASVRRAFGHAVQRRQGSPINPLSLRHTLILQNMALGRTTRQIADELFLSPKTIEKYRGEIFRRLGCKNQVQAIETARRLQLL